MSQRRDFSVLEKQVHQSGSHFPSMTVLFAVSAIALGAGVILALPDDPDSKPEAASAAASAPETTGSTTTAVDESLCDKQAWPYIDQRCAQRVEAARGTRQVRIVTDKGNSVTVRSPEPIVEPKPKPAPPAPVVAGAEKPIGPPAAPVAESPPQAEKVAAAPQQQAAPAPQNFEPQAPKSAFAPNVQVSVVPQQSAPAAQNPVSQTARAPASTVQTAAAPANPPVASDPVARGTPDPSTNIRNAPVAPAAASTAPMAAGVDAFAEVPPKKSKSARAAEKAAKREAKRQKAIAEDSGDVPEEVVATVKAAPADGQNSRRTRTAVPDRARSAVPDEVLQAVEQAAASEARGRGGRQVVIGSPRGNRIYVVPSDAIGGW